MEKTNYLLDIDHELQINNLEGTASYNNTINELYNEIVKSIKEYSLQLLQSEMDVNDIRFSSIAEQLYKDAVLVFFKNSSLYFNTVYSIIKELNSSFRSMFLETNSPIVRLYQGKYSGLLELSDYLKKQKVLDKTLYSNYEVKSIVLNAFHKGLYKIPSNIGDKTKSDLSKLEFHDLVVINNKNGYILRLSKQCKTLVLTDYKKYSRYRIPLIREDMLNDRKNILLEYNIKDNQMIDDYSSLLLYSKEDNND